MIRKGVYPYEYMGDWEKFEEVGLPPKDAFYSRLNMKVISDHHYEQDYLEYNGEKDLRLLSRYLLYCC